MNDVVLLENNEEYNVVNSVTYKEEKYILLSNTTNQKDICVRKLKKENDKEYICRLKDEELNEVLNLFLKENNILEK